MRQISLLSATFAFLVLGQFSATSAFAGGKAPKTDEKAQKNAEVTLKGSMTCGKCGLKETDKCQNVLKVTEAGKETKYFLADNEVAKKNHGQVCGGTASATVKGSVADDKSGGRKVLTASQITYE